MPEETRISAARHEYRDIGESSIWIAIAISGALLLACAALTFWLYPSSRLDRSMHLPLPPYPEPRLQPDPTADMRAFYATQAHRLSSAGPPDDGDHAAHIPIGQAMREVAQEGIAGWPAESPPP